MIERFSGHVRIIHSDQGNRDRPGHVPLWPTPGGSGPSDAVALAAVEYSYLPPGERVMLGP